MLMLTTRPQGIALSAEQIANRVILGLGAKYVESKTCASVGSMLLRVYLLWCLDQITFSFINVKVCNIPI